MLPGKRKLVIIHFLPLELYPPIMNLVDYIGKSDEFELSVISNRKGAHKQVSVYVPSFTHVKIFRPSQDHKNPLIRYINYFLFYSFAFIFLLFKRPTHILYFETLSSWPALLYKKLRGKKVALMAHYHEYTTPEEYSKRMLLSKWMYKLELKMYHLYSWISQTNPVRLAKFIADAKLEAMPKHVFHDMPNYPPLSWNKKQVGRSEAKAPVKLVYAGSLGYKNMYLKEVAEWLKKHQEAFTLDIYSHNLNEEARDFIENQSPPNIQYCGACDYQRLPDVFKKYDVGIVIYRPFSQNTIHAVSNKVFEYAACGLDVWFSTDMTFTFEFVKDQSYPKILPVDFGNLDSFDYEKALSREGLPFEASPYYCEHVYNELTSHILT